MEFPPKSKNSKPEMAAVPFKWIGEEEQLCWWPSHLKDNEVYNAIKHDSDTQPGFKQFPFVKILTKCGEYFLLNSRNVSIISERLTPPHFF